MIITLSWISVLLFLYLLFLVLKKDTKGKEFRIVVIVFLIIFFLFWDMNINGYKDVIHKFYLQKEEVCDMSEVWSDCNTTYSVQNNTYSQMYFGLLEQQITYINVLSGAVYGAILYLLWEMIQDVISLLRGKGLIKE